MPCSSRSASEAEHFQSQQAVTRVNPACSPYIVVAQLQIDSRQMADHWLMSHSACGLRKLHLCSANLFAVVDFEVLVEVVLDHAEAQQDFRIV